MKDKGEKMTLTWEKGSLIWNYTNKVIRENIWKVQNIGYTKEDLSQELYIVFHICKEKYKDYSEKFFFNCFKKAVENRIIYLAAMDARDKILKEKYTEPDTYDQESEIMLKMKIDEAPVNIRNFITCAINGDFGANDVKKKKIAKFLGTRFSEKELKKLIKSYIL
jgi:hypothetical protein